MVAQLWRGSLRSLLGLTIFFLVTEKSDSAERFWIDDNGGFFTSTSNWSATDGGASGASVPGVFDDANFNESGLKPVNFIFGSGNITNRRLDVRNGDVRFDLNNLTYTFTSGATIAAAAGQTARFTLFDGTVTGDSNGDDFNIGGSGSGFVTVGAGGTLGSGVSRPDIRMGTSSNLTNTFTASLTVEDSGEVMGQQLLVGSLPLANATVNVTGPVASASFASTVTVASGGTGTLNVTSGGTLSNTSSTTIGASETGDGRVFVRNPGSNWDMGGTLTVGGEGRGEMTISSEGRVTTAGMTIIGEDVLGSGEVNVSGFGSEWDVADNLDIGDAGAGELTVSSGGRVTNTGLLTVLARQSGSVGRVIVTGANSLWETTNVTVGSAGEGVLQVTAGGEVQALSLQIGTLQGGDNRVVLTGANSKLSTVGDVAVSSLGDGEMTVVNGAELYVGNDLLVNDLPSTEGILTLDGGSIFVGGRLIGSGTLNHRDGLLQVAGEFQPTASPSPLVIEGEDNGDLPTLDLIGNVTTNISAVRVGDTRRGELLVRQDRTLEVDNLHIGAEPGSEGTVVVQSRARLEASSRIDIGGDDPFDPGGNGTLVINSGARVAADTFRVYGDGAIHLNGGTLEFDDLIFFGSNESQFQWTTGNLSLAAGNQTLPFRVLQPGSTLREGQTVSGGSTMLTLNSDVTVDGGTIATNSLTINLTLRIHKGRVEGFSNGVANNGTVLLEGPLAELGSQLAGVSNSGTIRGSGSIQGTLTNDAQGQLQVTAGERMQVAGVNNLGHVSVIGGEIEASGLVTNVLDNGLISARDATLRFNGGVNNASGMVFSNGTVDIYGDITQQVGGRITVSNGGIANFYDDVTIDPGANDVQVSSLGGTVGSVVFFGSYNGGVTGGGQAFIEGDHRPGNSAGEVDFAGDVFYGPFSTLEIELGGLTPGSEFDMVDVAGEAGLSGDLEVSLIDGFQPSEGDTFEILNAAGGLTGTFFSTQLPTLAGGLNWNVLYGANNVILEVAAGLSTDTEPDGDVDGADFLALQRDNPALILSWQTEYGSAPSLAAAQNVPEPSAMYLLLLAAALFPCLRGGARF